MNPRHFLDIAELLIQEVENAPDANLNRAKCRTTFNRAYYAAFLVACELFAMLNLKVPHGSKCHDVVKAGLNNSGVALLVKISENLGTLYTGRADADYVMGNPRTESVQQAKLNVTLAKTIIAMIDAILGRKTNPPLDFSAIENTILEWAKNAGQPLYRK
jgi:hypothetical protein